jgi:hypothetical protein
MVCLQLHMFKLWFVKIGHPAQKLKCRTHRHLNTHAHTYTHARIIHTYIHAYEGVSRNSGTEAITKYTTPNKRVWKLPTSAQLRATWHTDSLDMVVLPSIGASRYHKCCVDDGTSPEYFRCTLVHTNTRYFGLRILQKAPSVYNW